MVINVTSQPSMSQSQILYALNMILHKNLMLYGNPLLATSKPYAIHGLLDLIPKFGLYMTTTVQYDLSYLSYTPTKFKLQYVSLPVLSSQNIF